MFLRWVLKYVIYELVAAEKPTHFLQPDQPPQLGGHAENQRNQILEVKDERALLGIRSDDIHPASVASQATQSLGASLSFLQQWIDTDQIEGYIKKGSVGEYTLESVQKTSKMRGILKGDPLTKDDFAKKYSSVCPGGGCKPKNKKDGKECSCEACYNYVMCNQGADAVPGVYSKYIKPRSSGGSLKCSWQIAKESETQFEYRVFACFDHATYTCLDEASKAIVEGASGTNFGWAPKGEFIYDKQSGIKMRKYECTDASNSVASTEIAENKQEGQQDTEVSLLNGTHT